MSEIRSAPNDSDTNFPSAEKDNQSPLNPLHHAKTFSANDPTDGRIGYNFKSGYPYWTRVQIAAEGIYLFLIILISIYLIFWVYAGNWMFYLTSVQFDTLSEQLKKIAPFPIAGLIGGAMFGLKYLYRVAARGWWHEDRRIWRICSPWLSAALALMVGIMLDGGLLGLSYSKGEAGDPLSTFLSVGFITGYFADSALAKLQEIANVVFGASSHKPSGESK